MVKKRQADLDVSAHVGKSRNSTSLAASNKVKKHSRGRTLLEVISSGKKQLKKTVDQDLKSSKVESTQIIPDDNHHSSVNTKSPTSRKKNRSHYRSNGRDASQPELSHLFPPTPSYPNPSGAAQVKKTRTPSQGKSVVLEHNTGKLKQIAAQIPVAKSKKAARINKMRKTTSKAVEAMAGTVNVRRSLVKEVERISGEVSVAFHSDERDSLVDNDTHPSHDKLMAKSLALKQTESTKSIKKSPRIQSNSSVRCKLSPSVEVEKISAAFKEEPLRKKNKTSMATKKKLLRRTSKLSKDSKAISAVVKTIYLPVETPSSEVVGLSQRKVRTTVTKRNTAKGASITVTPEKTTKFNESNIQTVLKDIAGQTPVVEALTPAYINQEMDTDDGAQALLFVGKNSWIVAFTHRIDIRGFASITSLTKSGQVEVEGHRLSFGQTADVYSPPGYHNGVIECLPSSTNAGIPSLAELRSVLLSLTVKLFAELADFCSHHEGSAIVHFSELIDHKLQPCLDMISFPKEVAGYLSLSERLFVSDRRIAARYSSTTVAAADHLVNHADAGQPLRVLVCGDKNLGKSTLIRYIMNRLLAVGADGVTHLECDPSQCEFSPPGCLTLHTVDQPLLGPPWTHLPSTVDHSQLYGALSADVAPDSYVSCVNKLVEEYEANQTSTPLLVNTMGWKQGLGLHFLSATIARVKPTHVIQLSTDSVSYKNFEAFTVFRLSQHDLFIPQHSVRELHEMLDYELMPLTVSHYDKLEFDYDVLSPTMSRDLTTTAYMFSSCLPHQRVVNDLTPYRVDMGDVAVELGSDKLAAHLVADSICMQVVVLCQTSTSYVEKVVDSDFLQLAPSTPLVVIGYGVVRAVDKNSKCLYVSTPLPVPSISQVNVIYKMQGTITPDLWFYLQLPKVKGDPHVPYLGHKKSGAGISATGTARYRYRKGR